ncbi:TRAP transporter small permease subunit [Thiocapsa rosea]|uniref:TRAP transporter small permease protein n=1 Tax=Thiocapsa rosea TaxID=69360 RepID=A0A495V8L1_9GAMM|nr:TRAP transporter small permease subunit [Thiocapsa rosea]RKT45649.1 TRAP-type mannitol/chloroaromatic compound transport system permease small subunit [Thiocapsa rosea]
MNNHPRPGGRARLLVLADRIDAVIRRIGEWATWLSLAMVLVTFAVVVLRYAFDIGSIALQESVTYMHAVLFMLGIAYTLGRNGHVRVDILYERLSRRARARVDLIGTLLLLIPVCVLIIWLGWAYVAESWRVQEASREAGGLPAVYLLKTLILIMPILLLAQGLSNALRNGLFLAGMEEALPTSDGEIGRA